jgi:hypothetical protein
MNLKVSSAQYFIYLCLQNQTSTSSATRVTEQVILISSGCLHVPYIRVHFQHHQPSTTTTTTTNGTVTRNRKTVTKSASQYQMWKEITNGFVKNANGFPLPIYQLWDIHSTSQGTISLVPTLLKSNQ